MDGAGGVVRSVDTRSADAWPCEHPALRFRDVCACCIRHAPIVRRGSRPACRADARAALAFDRDGCGDVARLRGHSIQLERVARACIDPTLRALFCADRQYLDGDCHDRFRSRL